MQHRPHSSNGNQQPGLVPGGDVRSDEFSGWHEAHVDPGEEHDQATGPITVPFIMALGVGLASVRSDKNSTSGTMLILSSRTMAVMGSTDERDSLIFSMSCGLIRTERLLSSSALDRPL